MKKPCDSSQIMYCSDQLMNAASNRYRLVVQVANRAKRRRYEELENFEDLSKKDSIIKKNESKIRRQVIKIMIGSSG